MATQRSAGTISFILNERISGTMSQEVATLGGGCFWCIEAVYEQLQGVSSVVSGYAGGAKPNPTYEEVCRGRTGHAEVAEITFDPAVTSFREILEVFFSVHDPTTKDRQGNDIGSQYRSVIFYHSDAQRDTAANFIEELTADDVWGAPIVTELSPAPPFFAAEDYHQGYYQSNAAQPYCLGVVRPKVAKFRKKWAHKLKP